MYGIHIFASVKARQDIAGMLKVFGSALRFGGVGVKGACKETSSDITHLVSEMQTIGLQIHLRQTV